MANYNTLSRVQLMEMAKERGIKVSSAARKSEIVELLENADAQSGANHEVNGKTASESSGTTTSATTGTRNSRTASESSGTTTSATTSTRNSRTASTSHSATTGVRNNRGDQERPMRRNTYAQNENNNTEGRSNMSELDSGITKEGILEIISDSGYGFIRCDNYLPGDDDVYVSPAQIRKFNLKTGDIVRGNIRVKSSNEKFGALLFVDKVNGFAPIEAVHRPRFEDMTPIYPNHRLHLETPGCSVGMRMMDLVSPIGKGQRGMIVSQPKAGKTTLLKQVANAILKNHPETYLTILLIDERPEEVTDIKESIQGENVEVIYSTFDELPENHKRVSEMVIEHARRMVEHKKDVVILLDSITRLARAYNLTVQTSGRTLSGGLDPAALHMPKKFFGAARNTREGGSLTILATALVETGSRMDDVVFEEFKGTGNMELVLDRNLSERRVFPAIDLKRSGTRRDDLLFAPDEIEANALMHRALNHGLRSDEAAERIIDMFVKTKNNKEFIEMIRKVKILE
ncbi:MAG: transcription termination factor Rho [Lachnospiraceae bacterium]|nr:transcription termination factor Rho [Lachnospiraceae bacterium]